MAVRLKTAEKQTEIGLRFKVSKFVRLAVVSIMIMKVSLLLFVLTNYDPKVMLFGLIVSINPTSSRFMNLFFLLILY